MVNGGHSVCGNRAGVLRRLPGYGQPVRASLAAVRASVGTASGAGVKMDATYALAGVIALLLLAYLVATLLKPEWFG